MGPDLIQDRGRGPEIAGTRITVYNLLPHFLEPSSTEASICLVYKLTPEQVAAARAYVLTHADTVLAEHLKIEARMAMGNPPEVIEQAKPTHATFLSFKEWLAKREQAELQEQSSEPTPPSGVNGSDDFPTFREWLGQRQSQPVKRS